MRGREIIIRWLIIPKEIETNAGGLALPRTTNTVLLCSFSCALRYACIISNLPNNCSDRFDSQRSRCPTSPPPHLPVGNKRKEGAIRQSSVVAFHKCCSQMTGTGAG